MLPHYFSSVRRQQKPLGWDGAAFRNDVECGGIVRLCLRSCGTRPRRKSRQGTSENNKNGSALPYAVAFRSSLYSSHQDENNNDDQNDAERPAGMALREGLTTRQRGGLTNSPCRHRFARLRRDALQGYASVTMPTGISSAK